MDFGYSASLEQSLAVWETVKPMVHGKFLAGCYSSGSGARMMSSTCMSSAAGIQYSYQIMDLLGSQATGVQEVTYANGKWVLLMQGEHGSLSVLLVQVIIIQIT